MVFARTKLVLEDNCFEEEPGRVAIKLSGIRTEKIYENMFELIKSVFNVTDSDIQETAYSWTKSKEREKFSVVWWVHKDLDPFSYLYVSFKLKGQSEGEEGSASIEARGLLRSEYPQDTVWQRSLFYEMMRTFWHRVFYHKKREEYAEECRHSIILFQRKIHEIFEKLKKK